MAQELGYTLVTVMKSPTVSIDLNRPPIISNQRPASPKDQVLPVFRPSSAQPSTDSGHDASPEYELEDPPNATHHPHSFGGNFHMQTWNTRDVEPLSESYVFDRRSRSLVRSRSEGHGTTLHPYVRHLFYFFDHHFRSDRRFIARFGYSGHL